MEEVEAKLEVPEVKDVDPKQLEMGILVEMEHTKDEEVAQKYATQSVEESAEKTTDYIKHRAFAMGKVWGSPSPIAPDKRAEWEEITGKKIK